ncbi:hypothetical protein CK203_110114 [Vitis vinifera]|uniref:PGG domain-containing protein n=1 Tax=Vitis vinifera TaxID=29760 RepID=A0A438BL90_VITVI|nr:hypothetical protein CK203_110114 [Vitis vinifera]
MAFIKEHEKLIKEGEKWMKGTAKFYTLAAALLATVVLQQQLPSRVATMMIRHTKFLQRNCLQSFCSFGCSFPLPIHCFGADMPIHSHDTICRR